MRVFEVFNFFSILIKKCTHPRQSHFIFEQNKYDIIFFFKLKKNAGNADE